jgi:hypothetical protein
LTDSLDLSYDFTNIDTANKLHNGAKKWWETNGELTAVKYFTLGCLSIISQLWYFLGGKLC